ncbi:MAG: NAD(P)H-dependent oxidoreductase [Clostridia bacterium]|nr:NAD(P)H-dependent oxidoreductase [Clostridia bacterium]
MEHTLFVNACPREGSRTLQLARHLLDKLDTPAEELRLFEENLLPLNGKTLALRDKMIAQDNLEHPIFKYARQFAAADTVVIAAPFWDLSFPSALKIWLEYVMALGVTFRYAENGMPQGLCKAKRLFYVSTAGGPVLPSHMGFDYVDALAKNYFSIEQTALFSAENLDVIGADTEAILAAARGEIDRYWEGRK